MRYALPIVVVIACAIFTVSSAQQNVTVNATDSSIQYGGGVGIAPICKLDASGQLLGNQPGCYNASSCTSSVAMGMSQSPNGSASFSFRGSAVYVQCLSNDVSPIYTVTLDGTATDIDGVRPSGLFTCNTLFSQTALDPTVDHNIALTIKSLSPNSQDSDDLYLFSLISFIYTTAEINGTTSASHTSDGTIGGTSTSTSSSPSDGSTTSKSSSGTASGPFMPSSCLSSVALALGLLAICI